MSRQAGLRKIAEMAANYCVKLPESERHARGVGQFVVLPRLDDGGKRILVLPKMQLSQKFTRFENRSWPEDLVNRNKLGVISPELKAFLCNMPSLNTEHVSGPEYYYEDGFRKVEPYFATYRSVAQSNVWPGVDKPLINFLGDRFSSSPRGLLELEVECGQIAVNLEKVPLDYMIRQGDVITRTAHFHETPVLDRKLNIIHDGDDLLVVDKPPSWPVHSCGNFRFNSLLYILTKEFGYRDLRPVHRLDRLTSGIIMLAKGKNSAAKYQKMLAHCTVQKVYLALVEGKFDRSHLVHSTPLSSHRVTKKVAISTKEKSAITEFKTLEYFPRQNYTLVECRPITGRTHQIRLHLQELGHPIVNDFLYGTGKSSFYESTPEKRESIENIIRAMKAQREADNAAKLHSDNSKVMTASDINEDKTVEQVRTLLEQRFSKHDFCLKCQFPQLLIQSKDPKYICLHSYRYSVGDLQFQSSLPPWIQELK